MNFDFAESQKMLRSAAREFFAAECPRTLVRQAQESETGYSPELWRQMSQLGWTGMHFPEEFGGDGASLLDMVILYEEMGRALAPVPHLASAILSGLTLLKCGSREVKEEYLPRIARGDACFTLALTEPGYGWEAASIATTAASEGDGYVVNGTKLFVPYGAAADYLLVTARSGEGAPEDGISLLIVDAKNSPGLTCKPLHGSFSQPAAEIVLDHVRVPESALLGDASGGWQVLNEVLKAGAVLQAAEAVGGAEAVLEMTVNYAKERKQFGQYIGSFQRIQDRVIRMVNDLDRARWVTYEAAWRLDEGLTCDVEVSAAKALASDGFSRSCNEAHHVTAGLGFMKDFDLHLYSRRAREIHHYLGSPSYHRKLLAKQLFG